MPLRRSAEERAFSLSAQAQDHVWDIADYIRVELEHCRTPATTKRAGDERRLVWANRLLCFMRTRLVLCMTWVLELDVTGNLTWLRTSIKILRWRQRMTGTAPIRAPGPSERTSDEHNEQARGPKLY